MLAQPEKTTTSSQSFYEKLVSLSPWEGTEENITTQIRFTNGHVFKREINFGADTTTYTEQIEQIESYETQTNIYTAKMLSLSINQKPAEIPSPVSTTTQLILKNNKLLMVSRGQFITLTSGNGVGAGTGQSVAGSEQRRSHNSAEIVMPTQAAGKSSAAANMIDGGPWLTWMEFDGAESYGVNRMINHCNFNWYKSIGDISGQLADTTLSYHYHFIRDYKKEHLSEYFDSFKMKGESLYIEKYLVGSRDTSTKEKCTGLFIKAITHRISTKNYNTSSVKKFNSPTPDSALDMLNLALLINPNNKELQGLLGLVASAVKLSAQSDPHAFYVYQQLGGQQWADRAGEAGAEWLAQLHIKRSRSDQAKRQRESDLGFGSFLKDLGIAVGLAGAGSSLGEAGVTLQTIGTATQIMEKDADDVTFDELFSASVAVGNLLVEKPKTTPKPRLNSAKGGVSSGSSNAQIVLTDKPFNKKSKLPGVEGCNDQVRSFFATADAHYDHYVRNGEAGATEAQLAQLWQQYETMYDYAKTMKRNLC